MNFEESHPVSCCFHGYHTIAMAVEANKIGLELEYYFLDVMVNPEDLLKKRLFQVLVLEPALEVVVAAVLAVDEVTDNYTQMNPFFDF